MILFDLICRPHGHVFEAWFASSDSYQSQKKDGLLQCPICASADVDKAVMAPRVGAKSNQQSGLTAAREREQHDQRATADLEASAMPAESASALTSPDAAKVKLAALAKMQAALLAQSNWVGRDFARQARAMDSGEQTRSSIYGEASLPEVKSLIEDGVDIMPLPLPVIPPNQSN